MLQFRSGNLIGLAVSPLILAAFGWRSLFLIFGVLGGPLLAFWLSVVPSVTSKGVQPCKNCQTGFSVKVCTGCCMLGCWDIKHRQLIDSLCCRFRSSSRRCAHKEAGQCNNIAAQPCHMGNHRSQHCQSLGVGMLCHNWLFTDNCISCRWILTLLGCGQVLHLPQLDAVILPSCLWA